MSISSLNQFISPTIKDETPSPLTPWSVSKDLFTRLHLSQVSTRDSSYRKAVVLPSDPEWYFVWNAFSQDIPNRYMIQSIFCIHNSILVRAFEDAFINQDLEALEFNATWRDEPHPEQRKKVMERWGKAAALFSPCTAIESDGKLHHWEHVKVFPLWHGTKEEICKSVCESGFTFSDKTSLDSKNTGDSKSADTGFLGNGIYFTNSARYAADIHSRGHLILSWVSMRSPFPVLREDTQKLIGGGAYKGYNAHYAPVRSSNPNDVFEPTYYPLNEGEIPHCDEMVVFQGAQILPSFWVQLELVDLYRKRLSQKPQCVEDLISIFYNLQINNEVNQDQYLRPILSTWLTGLLKKDSLDDLTAEELQWFEVMRHLLSTAGKVDRAVRDQLIALSGNAPLGNATFPFSSAASQTSTSSETKNQIAGDSLEAQFEEGKRLKAQHQYVDAIKYFETAAKGGYAPAQTSLGSCYYTGTGVEKDLSKAVMYYRLAAKQEHADAQYNLGVCYDEGIGVQKNFSEAVRCYRLAVKQGHVQAQYNLGVCYERGTGVKKKLNEAVRYYRLAAKQEYALAQNNLGVCYENGIGVQKDLNEAVRYYLLAAEQGHADAQYNLGVCYDVGRGVQRNLSKSVLCYRLAAEQGHAPAQSNLGVCYIQGIGVQKSLNEAMRYFRLAAEQGYTSAQCHLGKCYFTGIGVQKDLNEAIRYFRLAADKGNAEAQNNLGVCYEHGIGIQKNLNEAVKYYHLAAKQGHADSIAALKRLEIK